MPVRNKSLVIVDQIEEIEQRKKDIEQLKKENEKLKNQVHSLIKILKNMC